MTRIEVYLVALIVLTGAICGAYFKGRGDARQAIATEQLAANAKALEEAATAATQRAAADDAARSRADTFMARVDRGLTDVQAKFSKLPTVVVDSRGCMQLTDSARLRWNAVELLPAGSLIDAAAEPPAAVPAGSVPAP